MPSDFLAEMRWRGQLHQVTHEEALAKHLASGGRRAYVGFDPTADSLTIGNLVGIMALAKWQRAGHVPVAVMGGGTGQIGDPSGKSAERQLMTRERIAANVERIRKIFDPLLDFSAKASNRAVMVDNVEWLGKLSYLDALRDIGKHFSVNMMIQKDSVRERLHNRDQGISYTEFSYMILQSYDYLHLFREMGVTVQMGGSDQWGNIVGGSDLIRRVVEPPGNESYAITWPLVTKADGGKFGKTESGAIWLTAERTSPYAYYQFWLNAADSDAVKFLKTFTLLPKERIDALEASHAADPSKREAQRELAREATALLHGPTERDAAEAAAAALFSGDVASLPKKVLEEVMAEIPSSTHDKALLGAGMPLVDLLTQTTLVKSKREAKEFLASGSVTVNGKKAGAEDKVTVADLLHGEIIALRRGKKSWHVTRWG
jgi:tyrosyl-tRNA synthetase